MVALETRSIVSNSTMGLFWNGISTQSFFAQPSGTLWKNAIAFLKEVSRGPFLERPGNFLDPKENRTCWMVAKFLAHKPASSASLTDSSIVSLSTLLIDLECKHNEHKTTFRARKVTGTFEKRASVQFDTNMTPTPFFGIQVPQLFHTPPQNKPYYWPKEVSARESCFRICWLLPRRLSVVRRLSGQEEREGRWEGEKMEDDWHILFTRWRMDLYRRWLNFELGT